MVIFHFHFLTFERSGFAARNELWTTIYTLLFEELAAGGFFILFFSQGVLAI